jgi:hypothetical protein
MRTEECFGYYLMLATNRAIRADQYQRRILIYKTKLTPPRRGRVKYFKWCYDTAAKWRRSWITAPARERRRDGESAGPG